MIKEGGGLHSLLGMTCLCDLEFKTPMHNEFCNKNNTTFTCVEITHNLEYYDMSNLSSLAEIDTSHTHVKEIGCTKMWL